MCGIIGAFNTSKACMQVEQALALMSYRGIDGYGMATATQKKVNSPLNDGKATSCIGHCLHSIVGTVSQPLGSLPYFSANCEIYNWKTLKEKYRIIAANDAEVLLWLLQHKGISSLSELDGVYAFIYWDFEKVICARDILGVKPLWYSHSDGFFAASERKALEGIGKGAIEELHPRTILTYSLKTDRLSFTEREFFSLKPEHKGTEASQIAQLDALLKKAIAKRIPERKIGVLFSGGIDSTIIAWYLKQLGADFTCYTTSLHIPGQQPADDEAWSRNTAKKLGFPLTIRTVALPELQKALPLIVPLIEDTNVVKVGVGATFHFACEEARKDCVKVIFSGLGSEELFAGYQRHKNALDINKECLSGLRQMYERDLYRDDVISMYNNLEIRLPFLDKDLASYALKIPGRRKIAEGKEKFVLRKLAESKGLPSSVVWRKKKAAQYGSKIDHAIEKLAGKQGKSAYLSQFLPRKQLRLGVLISSGKDSLYALYTMKRQNYDVVCGITMRSSNQSSYMFHTPNVRLVELQAKAMGLPLIEQETQGEKENELDDLSNALARAKKESRIDGVITGAIASTYQRDRIENICEKLGLKVFSPLWHLNQETYMRELLRNGFSFILSSVAADGLNEEWLGRVITKKDIDRLATLHQKNGINIAFEGGEAESLVLDCPLFEKKIKIISHETTKDREGAAFYTVQKAALVEKP